MANQIGSVRVYGGRDEATSPALVSCPLCKTQSVPRTIVSTRRVPAVAGVKTHCMNCGHVYNQNKTNPAE